MVNYLLPGDLGVYVRPGSLYFGSELTIVGEAKVRYIMDPQGNRRNLLCYVVDCPAMGPTPAGFKTPHWALPVEYVRRRPPKQDWNNLCNLSKETLPA